MRPKRVSPVWYWLGVNSAPLKWGCFWHQFLGLNRPNCNGQFGKYWSYIGIYRGKNSPPNFSPLPNDPFKNSQFSSNEVPLQKKRALSSPCQFPPLQTNNENTPHTLSFKHSFIGSRYCLCKNLLQCMILQLRILIVVKNRQTLKHHVKE